MFAILQYLHRYTIFSPPMQGVSQSISSLTTVEVKVYVYTCIFHLDCTVTDLGITTQDETVDPRCTVEEFLSSSAISNGVVCYNGTAEGSRTFYICNDNYTLMEGDEVTRVCQGDGNWNGSTPQCIREGSSTYCNCYTASQ